ncbi:MAG: GNAT family N-acetyltransferase [Hyphomicrobiaceae bacterium]
MAAASGVRVEALTGDRIAAAIPDVARLRIAVFRDWPYLYDGSLDYERAYLSDFAVARDAVIVAAFDGENVVGAATASPLDGHSAQFAPVLAAGGYDPGRVFYFGESVLLPAYRGRGLGHAFFDEREQHARACECPGGGPFAYAAFCAVVRDQADPRAPRDYRPLDAFWRKRGYRPTDGVVGSYRWQEIGAVAETAHDMQFWISRL